MRKTIKKTGADILSKIGIRDKIIEPPGISMNEPIVFYAFLEKIELISEKSEKWNEKIPNRIVSG